MVKRKEQSIETIRGIAIILMVAGHVIGHNITAGLLVEDDSVWRYIYKSLEHLRMPLFTAVSGFVYAIRPFAREDVGKFFTGKARRILLPLISVASLQFVVNAVVPNVNNPTDLKDIWKIYIYAYGQFWFLQALFLVFILVIVLEYYKIMSSFKKWGIVAGLAFLFLILVRPVYIPEVFSFRHMFYLLPFFLLGVGLNRYAENFFTNQSLMLVILVLMIGIIIQQFNWHHVIDLNYKEVRIKGTLIGLTGVILFIYYRRAFTPLARLGYYSYGIYLFHVFGTAGSRIVSQTIGIDNLFLLFFIGMVFGLGVPILIELVLLRSKILRRLFLGLR